MRTKDLKNVFDQVFPYELEGLTNFLKQPTPHPESLKDISLEGEERMVATPNKSYPYLKINRWLETTKDGDPAYCYEFSLEGYSTSMEPVSLGTFTQSEILETINSLNLKPNSKVSPNQPSKDYRPKEDSMVQGSLLL